MISQEFGTLKGQTGKTRGGLRAPRNLWRDRKPLEQFAKSVPDSRPVVRFGHSGGGLGVMGDEQGQMGGNVSRERKAITVTLAKQPRACTQQKCRKGLSTLLRLERI